MQRINVFDEIYKKCNSLQKETLSFPRYIDIELTNNCNYRCLMCPTGIGTVKREKGFMDKKVFLKIINETKKFQTPIRFSRWGEPTMHKEFYEFLELAKENNLSCHFNTNGWLLNEETMKKIIDMQVESVKFSFQGVDRESYMEMRNKDTFDSLVEKIKLFSKLRGEKKYPYLHVSTTVTYESEEQIENFKKILMPYVDLLTVGNTNLAYIYSDSSSLNEEEKKRLENLKNSESLVRKHAQVCPEAFDKLSINWDGKVTVCCKDYDDYMILGDLNQNSIQQIWNCEKLKQYRKLISNGEYDKMFLCKTCFETIELRK